MTTGPTLADITIPWYTVAVHPDRVTQLTVKRTLSYAYYRRIGQAKEG